MSWHELTYLPENLLWAWRKVRRAYRSTDALFHWGELAKFELCLEQELASIESQFRAGKYKMSPLILVPQPKKPAADGTPRLRQYFQVSVRDQVAWMAIVNAIGPSLDRQMPGWSYGNRLYRAAWYDDPPADDIPSKLNLGPYRHSGGHLYRHFKHSWPLYRRHVALTARRMANDPIRETELDLGERLAFGQIEGLPYLQSGYFHATGGTTLYAASLDLKKFYPSIRIDALRAGLNLLPGYAEDEKLVGLIESLLHFKVDTDGLSSAMRDAVDPKITGKMLAGLPTGLFVSGFLANVAMLPIDHAVSRMQLQRRNIAHFRFVDDHEVLAYSPEELIAWIKEYDTLLKAYRLGAEIEQDKYVPPQLKFLVHGTVDEDLKVQDPDKVFNDFKKSAQIDGLKPTSLMTRTLAQVSMLAATNFDLLTDAGRVQRLEQLEWLLLANIPDHEIRADTRAAFAASRIALLTPGLFRVDEEHLISVRRLSELQVRKKLTQDEHTELDTLQRVLPTLSAKAGKNWQATLFRYFGLLMEAFQGHPDKVRLFIKLFDYCRVTGFNGFPIISKWMKSQGTAEAGALKCYLGSMAVHVVARHVATAVRDACDVEITHRDRRAAIDFLSNVSAADWHSCIPLSGRVQPLECFQRDALQTMVAACLLGAMELKEREPNLAHKLLNLGAGIPLDTIDHSIETLASATDQKLGVWVHWYLSASGLHRYRPPSYWPQLSALLDPESREDWASARRFPTLLPDRMWEYLRSAKSSPLARDDGGWLLDAATANREAFRSIKKPTVLTRAVASKMAEQSSQIDLLAWVALARSASIYDPRRSEWTALEIVKKILRSIEELEGPSQAILDDLQPANVFVPVAWRDLGKDVSTGDRISWEAWRKLAGEGQVKFSRTKLFDYRYSEVLQGVTMSWPRRLRGVGQLLWGLLRLSFELPSAWNIRGQERSLVDLVGFELERLPISSHT